MAGAAIGYRHHRYLPIARALLDRTGSSGRLTLHAPSGTQVHAIEGGRVELVDRAQSGEIAIKADADRVFRYGRLKPSSIRHEVGSEVQAGDIIGAVGSSAMGGDSHPSVIVGLQDGAGRWIDLYDLLVGAPDPGVLLLDAPAEAEPASAEPTRPPDRVQTAAAVQTVDDAEAEDDALAQMIAKNARRSQ